MSSGDPAWVRRIGSGARQALMVHCSLAHSGEWAALGALLGDRLAMVAFDLPGHGRAPAHDPARDIGDEAVVLARPLIEAAGGPVDLMGHSFGGALALRLAVEWPRKVRSLTLIEPTLFAAARAAGAPEVQAQSDEMAELNRLLAEGRAGEAARRFTDVWGAGADWAGLPGAQRRYITDRVGLIPASGPVLWDDSGRILPRLGRVACPVLLMAGQESPAIIHAIASALAARLNDVRQVTVPGARHMLPVTHAPEVAVAITDFLGI